LALQLESVTPRPGKRAPGTHRELKDGLAVTKNVQLKDVWSGPEGSRKLRFPDYMATAQDGGKVVSLMHRPPLPPVNAPGTHFC
jgi:hypothetical protein